jgi:galactokinase
MNMEINEVKRKFVEIYGGTEEDLRVFASPGRVNLIGEHTDYNGGYVFPAALTLRSLVIIRPRKDRKINLAVTDLDVRVEASLDSLEEYKTLKWGNYQLGVADELQKAGYSLTGCDMLFDDTVPIGSGLSSSAAIEVATAIALVTLGNEANGVKEEIDMVEMAKLSQRAENRYVGVNCGIMDQFASAMGKANHAIFLDCKDLSFRHIPLNLKGFRIVIANTNKKRSLAAVKYNERRSECETGMEILKNASPQASCLGEISLSEYAQHKHLIKNETIRKRVEHVISEDDRVLRSVEALERDDLKEFGRLMIESHNSLKNLYEVTGIELDTLVEEAWKVDGVIGSRMTGAGFGGCTISIVKDEAVDDFKKKVSENYKNKVGLTAQFYIADIGDGAGEI